MRNFISVSPWLALSTFVLALSGYLAPGAGAAPATSTKAPSTPIQSTTTKPADPDGMLAYPDAPEGFNVERPGKPHGDVKIVDYDSKSLGTHRQMRVYTPPGYKPDQKYPVLYMLHGLGNNSTEWTQRAHAPQIADNLLADGKIKPLIIVFPNGDALITTTNPAGGGRGATGYGDPFEKDLLKDIIPFVESHYSTLNDRQHRALGGMSMGAGQTLNIGLSHIDTFAWLGAVAAAPNTKAIPELIPDPDALKKLSLLWLAVGKQDGLMRINQGVHTFLLEKGVPHVWRNDNHAHDTAEMGNNFYYFVQHIFKD